MTELQFILQCRPCLRKDIFAWAQLTKGELVNFATLLTFKLDVLQETSSLLFTKLTCQFSQLVKTWKYACLFIRSAFFSLVTLPITNVNPNPNPNVVLCGSQILTERPKNKEMRPLFQFRPRLQLVSEISSKLILENINALVCMKQALVCINLHVWLVRSATGFLSVKISRRNLDRWSACFRWILSKRNVIVLSNYGIHYPSTCCLLLIYLARLRSESC